MKGYLSQIGSAGAAGRSSARLLRPFIRSRSPIAENDQRMGLSGWEFPLSSEGSETLPPDTAVPDDQGATRTLPRHSPRDYRHPTPNVVAGPSVLETPAAAATHATPLRLTPSEPKTLSQNPESREPATGSAFAPKPDSVREIPHQENEPLGIQSTKDAGQALASKPTSLAKRSTTAVAPSLPIRLENVDSEPKPRPRSRQRTGEDPEPRLCPGPESQPAPHRSDPAPGLAAEGSTPKHEHDNGPPARPDIPAAVAPSHPQPPQVVIDRLEIEVVPPPAAAAPKPSGNPRRESGAGRPQRPVSQIGPLSQSTASRHYLSLRYR